MLKDPALTLTVIGGLLILLIVAVAASGGFVMPKDAGGWFYEYQTTISVAVAFATMWVIWHQYLDSISRKRFFMKAQMMDALVGLSEYVRLCFLCIDDPAGEIPQKPESHMTIFKNSIEFLDKNSAPAIFELIRFYQIHNSRLYSFKNDGSPFDNSQVVYDAIYLNFLIIRIWEFARGEKDVIPNGKPDLEDMISSLRALVGTRRYMMSPENYQDYVTIIQRRYPNR